MSNQILEQLSKKSKKKKEISVLLTSKKAIVKSLLVLFKKHIGIENKISRKDIFIAIMGFEPSETSLLESWAIWKVISDCIHLCRQRTKCQIISDHIQTSRYYWVANSWSDAKIYEDFLDTQIHAMHKAKKRMSRSITEEWYAAAWEYK